MGRNLVLLFDGTGNQFSVGETSVARLDKIAGKVTLRQHVRYDPGLGTMAEPRFFSRVGRKLSELYGLAFGAGITRKVEDAYSVLMKQWRPGDDVFLFGFSRGAYTARVLAGFLYQLGLLRPDNENLIPYAMRLYKATRGSSSMAMTRHWDECERFRMLYAQAISPADTNKHFQVRYMGLWDTVSFVGWVWNPVSFQNTHRNPGVKEIRHAVSLDERRSFYRQNLMVEAKQAGQDFKQHWFPGVHGDIGGSYPRSLGQNPAINSGVWVGPFQWIVTGATLAGLCVDIAVFETCIRNTWGPVPLWTQPIRNSLKEIWWILEIFPKKVWRPDVKRYRWQLGLGKPRFVRSQEDWIDEWTLRRIWEDKSYNPPNLSERFIQSVRSLSQLPTAMVYQA